MNSTPDFKRDGESSVIQQVFEEEVQKKAPFDGFLFFSGLKSMRECFISVS